MWQPTCWVLGSGFGSRVRDKDVATDVLGSGFLFWFAGPQYGRGNRRAGFWVLVRESVMWTWQPTCWVLGSCFGSRVRNMDVAIDVLGSGFWVRVLVRESVIWTWQPTCWVLGSGSRVRDAVDQDVATDVLGSGFVFWFRSR